jgi:glycosyltransferase involved in cell wall biosynthesis
MSDFPFFSVCIPNYNYERFIAKTLQSVLEQTFFDFEVIVVDNASTDNSWEVIKEYAARDKRIRIFRNQYNIGFAPNLQKATAKALGQYLVLLSSDDLMYPDALSSYREIIGDREDPIVLHAGTDEIDPEGVIKSVILFHTSSDPSAIFHSRFKPEDVLPNWIDGTTVVRRGIDVLKASLLQGKPVATFLSTCYPKRMWEQVEGYDMKYIYSPDYGFLTKILSFDPDFVYLKKRLFGYRLHPTNQSAQANSKGALKQQCDRYVQSFSLENHILVKTEINQEELQQTFIRVFCLKECLIALRQGFWLKAFKLFQFAWATYPKQTLICRLTYLCLFLLILGPISKAFLGFFYSQK